MRVLIVEDDEYKEKQIVSAMQSLAADRFQIKAVRSVKSAEASLFKEAFDLVLLDMSLPTFDVGPVESGGRPQGFGGREVLDFIEYLGVDCKVILITQFRRFNDKSRVLDLDDLKGQLLSDYERVLVGVVFFESGTDRWKKSLWGMIDEIG